MFAFMKTSSVTHTTNSAVSTLPAISGELTPDQRLASLETLARHSAELHANKIIANVHGDKSTPFSKYCAFMGISEAKFNSYLQEILARSQTPNSIIFAADIGESFGTAAHNLDGITLSPNASIAAFQISRHQRLCPDGTGLSPERSILADVNSMPEVPNNSFDLIVSFNSLKRSNLTQSLAEIERVLRPGGIALLDIESWRQTEKFAQISAAKVYSKLEFSMRGHEPIRFVDYLEQRQAEKNPFATQTSAEYQDSSYFLIRKA